MAGCIRDGCSTHTAVGSGRLGAVSPLQPVVVDADRLKLELHRRHDHPDVLDHRSGILRGRRVHGLLCLPLSSHRGKAGSLQSRNKKLEWWLSIGTAIGVAAMLAPGLVGWYQFVTVPADATEVEVMGQQWLWSYRLPGKDGRLGTSDARNVSSDNPMGLNPDDPHGQDDVVIQGDDLHLPVGKPVKVLLRSIDVLHDFYVPEFRAKMDMIPGSVTYYWFTPTRTGTFEVLCAELCGAAHVQMRRKVIVEEEKDYHAWLEKQRTFAELSGRRGVAKAAYKLGSE